MGVQFSGHVHPPRISRPDGSRPLLRPSKCANGNGEESGVAGIVVVYYFRLDFDRGTVDGTVYSNRETVPRRQDHGVGHRSITYQDGFLPCHT